MKQEKQPQHRVAVFMDPPLFKKVKRAAEKRGTSITQYLAQLASEKLGYEGQMKPRKFNHAA